MNMKKVFSSRIFAQLLYRRELKNLIKELKSKNNIRYEPILAFNSIVNAMIILYVVMLGITLLTNEPNQVLELAIVTIIFSAMIYIIQNDYNNVLLAYGCGTRHEGVIVKIMYKSMSKNTYIKCRLDNDKRIISLMPLFRYYGKNNGFEIGGKVGFYQSPINKHKYMIDLNALKKSSCIRKSLLEKKENKNYV